MFTCKCLRFNIVPRKLFKRVFKLGYCKELIENIITQKDKKLWERITDKNSVTALDDLLPPERSTVTSS